MRTFEEPVLIGENSDGQKLYVLATDTDSISTVRIDDSRPIKWGSFFAHTHGAIGWDLDEEAITRLLEANG